MRKNQMAIILVVFACLLSACSLSSSRQNDDKQEPLPGQNVNILPDNPILIVDDNDATEEADIQPTSTPRPTSTPINTIPNGNTNGGNTSGGNTNGGNTNGGTTTCVIRTDWQLYTIASGDTLSSIARRVNSTVSQLAAANCINDPSRISVGQSLRVPSQPVSQNQQVGTVVPSRILIINSGVRAIPANQTISLSWQGASLTGLSSVEFLYYPSGSSNGVSLGVDSYLTDGAAISWYVPLNVYGRIVARAQINTGGIRYSFDLLVASQPENSNGTFGYVTFSPANTTTGTDYTFNEGQTVTMFWTQLPVANVSRVEFYMAIASAGSPAPTLIGTDTNMSNGVSATMTLTARSSGAVTAIAYRTDGTTVVTEQATTVYVFPTDSDSRSGNVSVYPAPRSENGVALLVEGSQVTLSWQNMPNIGILQVEFVYTPNSGNTYPQSIGIDTNLADGIAVNWTVPAGASGRIHAAGRAPGQNHEGAASNDYLFRTVPADNGGGTTTSVQGAYQPFENGFMLWRSDPDGIYSFQNNGFVNYFSGSVYQALPENPVTDVPPPNRFKPVQGFGRVWGNVDTERSALGWALAQEQGYTMTITRFEGSGGPTGGGYMIVTLPDGRRVTVRDNGSWEFSS
ncbi:MAG: LysM domain-containing protein [Aggregatilineales bacterium]